MDLSCPPPPSSITGCVPNMSLSSFCWRETCPNPSLCTKPHLSLNQMQQQSQSNLAQFPNNNGNHFAPQTQPYGFNPVTPMNNFNLPNLTTQQQQPYLWPVTTPNSFGAAPSAVQSGLVNVKTEPVMNPPAVLQRSVPDLHDSGTESNSASPAPLTPDKHQQAALVLSQLSAAGRRSSFSNAAAPHSILASMLRGEDRVDSSLSSYADSDSHGFRSRSSTLSSAELPPVRPVPRRCSFSVAAILEKNNSPSSSDQPEMKRRNSVSVKQPAGLSVTFGGNPPAPSVTPDLGPLNLHSNNEPNGHVANQHRPFAMASAFATVTHQNQNSHLTFDRKPAALDQNNNQNQRSASATEMKTELNHSNSSSALATQMTSPASSSTSTTHADSQPNSPCTVIGQQGQSAANERSGVLPIVGANTGCVVCGDKASGYHYGVISCEGCKGFFRRAVQKGMTYQCHKTAECVVNRQTRNRCQSCRFEKCLRTGMCRESVRQDRNRKRKIRDEREEHELLRIQNMQSIIRTVVTAHLDTNLTFNQSTVNLSHVLFEQMSQSGTAQVAAFIDRIPGFNQLSPQDRLCLKKNAIPQIILMRVASSYLGPPPPADVAPQNNHLREVCVFVNNLRSLFVSLHLFQEELALLTAVSLMSPKCVGLWDVAAVDQLRGPLMEALRVQVQLQAQPGRDPNIVYAKLLMKLSEVELYARVLGMCYPPTSGYHQN